MRILIPNATTPRNIGDLAMLEVLLNLVRKAYPTAQVTLHISEPELFTLRNASVVRKNLYSWIMFPSVNPFVRLWRTTRLILEYIAQQKDGTVTSQDELSFLVRDYRDADMIIYTGGGYLRSQKGFRNAVSLLSLASVYVYARLSRARKIMMPISFGPFAYQWQERLFASLLKEIDTVLVREEYSFSLLQKHGITNLIQSEDLVLLSTPSEAQHTGGKKVGFTILKWFDERRQNEFEITLVRALKSFASRMDLELVPIVQVNGPETGDVDFTVAERVADKLRKLGVLVARTEVVSDLGQAKKVYGQLSLMVGMRMHSNILAALCGIPFVALGYEYKTQGIANRIGMGEYCLDSASVTEKDLARVIEAAWESRSITSRVLAKTIGSVGERELPKVLTALSKTHETTHPSLSIGIAAYNAEKNIAPLLQSLLDQNMDSYEVKEIIVHIDEGQDNTRMEVERLKSAGKVRVITTVPRGGYANACKCLLAESSGDIVILLNDDIQIKSKFFLGELIAPFSLYSNVGLICGSPVPLPARSFAGKVGFFDWTLWYKLKMSQRQGNSIFSVDGKALALSKAFVGKLYFPSDLKRAGNVDTFIYLSCVKAGFNYFFSRRAEVFYQTPHTFRDYFKWLLRNFATHKYAYQAAFGALASAEWVKPKFLYPRIFIVSALRHPLLAITSLGASFYTRLFSKSYMRKFTPTWSVVESTKKL